MAGVCDKAFREVCTRFGATHTVSEMVSAKALVFGDKKSHKLCLTSEKEFMGLQLFGNDENNIAKAIDLTLKHNPKWIDINMGCPVPKIVGNGEGSALMRSPKQIETIVKFAKNATVLPISIKIRTGIDGNINAIECAKAAESGGANFIAVHGRCREQYYSGVADRDIIGEVKKAVSIPVIANGDIDSASSAVDMFLRTSADGIMVGRAALGNPFLFRELKHFFEYGELPKETSVQEKMQVAREHVYGIVELKGERIGILETRKHLAWYIKGLYGSSALRNKINKVATLKDVENVIDEIISN